MEAYDVTNILAYGAIPYSTRILYGLLIDTCKIGNSWYKYFICIFSSLQFSSCLFLLIYSVPESQKYITIIFLALNWLCVSANDLITSVLLIHQAKLDIQKGNDVL